MKIKLMLTGTLVVIASLAIPGGAAIAQDTNPLRDAGFEEGIRPADGGWRLFGPSQVSDKHALTGSRSMFNGGSSRNVNYAPHFVGTVSGSFQEFPAAPGSRWRLTGSGMTVDQLEGTAAFGILQISFFDAGGKDLGTVETAEIRPTRAKLSNEVNRQSPEGEWIPLNTGVATAPEGTASVQAFTLYVDYSGSNVFQGVHFDDLALCLLQAGSDTECVAP